MTAEDLIDVLLALKPGTEIWCYIADTCGNAVGVEVSRLLIEDGQIAWVDAPLPEHMRKKVEASKNAS